jgi:hypothetical protein
MSKRCARCGEFNPRRSMQPPGDWVDHLTAEHGLSDPLGTLVVPLCRECYADAVELEEDGLGDDAEAFLAELDTQALVDDVAG